MGIWGSSVTTSGETNEFGANGAIQILLVQTFLKTRDKLVGT
jgi:hypothetical protein